MPYLVRILECFGGTFDFSKLTQIGRKVLTFGNKNANAKTNYVLPSKLDFLGKVKSKFSMLKYRKG